MRIVRESLRLALEHHLPDDVGRAYTNLTNQGAAGISLFPPAEAEALFEEMLDYDENVVPDGAFHQWHREGRAELWAMHGRWAEAEAELRELLGTVGVNRYLLVNASSYLGLLLGFRGRYNEAADLTDRFGKSLSASTTSRRTGRCCWRRLTPLAAAANPMARSSISSAASAFAATRSSTTSARSTSSRGPIS